eukprot:m.81801 g.81801  ORF g.81801 m.81801 type:complete len:106 (+) comp36254_c0_seq1:495-812(+)
MTDLSTQLLEFWRIYVKGFDYSTGGRRIEHVNLLLESAVTARLLLSLCNNFSSSMIPLTVENVLAKAKAKKLLVVKKHNVVRPCNSCGQLHPPPDDQMLVSSAEG